MSYNVINNYDFCNIEQKSFHSVRLAMDYRMKTFTDTRMHLFSDHVQCFLITIDLSAGPTVLFYNRWAV